MVDVKEGIEYIDSLHEEDFQRLEELLGCTVKDMTAKDIVSKLEYMCRSQQREIEESKADLNRAIKMVEQSVATQRELRNAIENINTISDNNITDASKLLGDFELGKKIYSGQITVDKILTKVLEAAANSRLNLEKFTKQRLVASGYQLKENDGADTVICNLLMKMDSDKKKIDELQNKLNVSHCKNNMNMVSDNTMALLEQTLPKQFDAKAMVLQRDQQMLDVNLLIGSLVQTIEGMKNLLIQCRKEMNLIKGTKRKESSNKEQNNIKVQKNACNSERDKLVIKLRREEMTQAEIAEALSISRGTVYNILKKYGVN